MWCRVTTKTKAMYLTNVSHFKTEILEANKVIHSVLDPTTILHESCLQHRSSLDGREEYAVKILKTRSKLPVLVDEENEVYMFPTLSKRNKDCVWLAYYHIHDYKGVDDRTLVTFKDGAYLYVNSSIISFDLQFKKTSQVIAQSIKPIHFCNEN